MKDLSSDMIAVKAFGGRKVAVLGLGRSGLATARALKAGGADPILWDDNETKRREAADMGFTLADPASRAGYAALILSPGIPLTHPKPHPAVAAAEAAGAPVVGDMDLFEAARPGLPEAELIAITGTNGKSTTTALIAHILAACGVPSVAAGNIGRPVLALDPLPEGGVYVFEISSYQIDLSPSLRPQAAILLNITPDHLDRHGGMAGYVAVKRKLFANQQAGDMAVIGIDDDHCAAICNELTASSAATVVPLSVEQAVEGGIYVKDGILFDTRKGHLERIGDLSEAPALKGSHNWQNAAAAYAVASRFVADRARLFGAICSFPGLAHRMEAVGTWEGVAFINDSKATNQASAARALASFEHIHWIAGGIAKEDNLNAVIPFLPRMEKAYLIGRAAPVFEAALKGLLPVVQCGDMLTAMQAAAEDAVKAGGGTVLLSPAAASQDQFRDYEERGDVFRTAARQWIEERKKG